MMMGGQQQHFLPGQQQQQFVQSLSHHTQIPQQQMGQPGGGLNQHQLQQYLQQQQQQKAQQAAALAQQQKQAQQQALGQQALNSALPGMQQPQQFQQFPGMQQPAGLTNMLLGGQQAPPFMQQQQGQVPLDIFALANKASQALSGLPQVNAPAMNMNPNFPPRPPAAAQSTFVGGSEQELPQMVQYAVQVRDDDVDYEVSTLMFMWINVLTFFTIFTHIESTYYWSYRKRTRPSSLCNVTTSPRTCSPISFGDLFVLRPC